MSTARVTNSTNEFIRNPHFCSVFLIRMFVSSTGYLSGDTDSVIDETESDNDQDGFLRPGNTS